MSRDDKESRGKVYHDPTVVKHDRYDGESIVVWGGMGMAYKTLLILVQSNLTGMAYRENILQPQVLPALQVIGPGAVLQNNSRPHRARVVKNSCSITKSAAYAGRPVFQI